MAFAELEQKALEHSLQAVKLDNQGEKDKADGSLPESG